MLLRWKTIYLNEKITRLICQFRVDVETVYDIWYFMRNKKQKLQETTNSKRHKKPTKISFKQKAANVKIKKKTQKQNDKH